MFLCLTSIPVVIGFISPFLRANESVGSAVLTVAVLSGELEDGETVFISFSTQTLQDESSATGQKQFLRPLISSQLYSFLLSQAEIFLHSHLGEFSLWTTLDSIWTYNNRLEIVFYAMLSLSIYKHPGGHYEFLMNN